MLPRARRRSARLVCVLWWSVLRLRSQSSVYQELNPKGLEIIGVAMAYDPPEQVRAMAVQRQIPYPIVMDRQERIAQAYDNVRLTPTTVLISPEGQIVQYQLGLLNMPKLRETIRGML